MAQLAMSLSGLLLGDCVNPDAGASRKARQRSPHRDGFAMLSHLPGGWRLSARVMVELMKVGRVGHGGALGAFSSGKR